MATHGPITAWDWRYYDEALAADRVTASTRTASASTCRSSRPSTACSRSPARCSGSSTSSVPDARAWHESVRLYEIRDTASAAEPIAHFYADLHPREGKFGHAAAFPLVVGHRAADGS